MNFYIVFLNKKTQEEGATILAMESFEDEEALLIAKTKIASSFRVLTHATHAEDILIRSWKRIGGEDG